MSTYVEYELDDGSVLYVEVDEAEQGLVRASRESGEPVRAERKFGDALDGVKKSAQTMMAKFRELRADEVELTFGLKVAGEVGHFAIAKAGLEANYEVTLKWKNQDGDK